MNKAQLDMLEKVFAAQIYGELHQTKSKVAKQLEDDGYIFQTEKVLGKDRFGVISIKGYDITHKGNIAYCTSDRCKEEVTK